MNNELKKQFRLVFERVSDPFLLVDGEGYIIDFNPAARRVLDIGESEHIADVVSIEKSFVFNTGEVLALLARSDSVHGVRLSDEEGNPADVSLDVVCLDTNRSRQTIKLIHIKDFSTYGSYERWKDELISMVAHEIKNPLSAMKNSMGIILSQVTGPVNDEQNLLLQTSIRGIDRLTRLLDGFLDISRINAGKHTLEPRWVNIHDFAPDVVDSFGTLFNITRQTLNCHVADDVEQVFVDAPKLEQVLINLLSNAVKFTPGRGEILISVDRASLEALREDLRILNWSDITDLRFIRIRVTDSGIGMTGETVSRLFTRFYEKGDGGGLKGSHLGLNISKTLTEVQYGSLEIDSEPGVGTEATVYLPEDENTILTLSRIVSMERCVTRVADAKKDAFLYVIKKNDSVMWPDWFDGWTERPVLNPSAAEEKGAPFVGWTLGSQTVVLLSPDRERVRHALDPVTGCVVGRCTVPEDGVRVARLLKLALNRIKTPVPVWSRT